MADEFCNPLLKDTEGCIEMPKIVCPVCGDHQCCDSIGIRARKQAGGCEDVVQIDYHCSGHVFTLVVHNHEGGIRLYFMVDDNPAPVRYAG